ncbi:hypothetical protein TRVA0_018S02498 [Trichomonascus vanleenenianus]|uniref:uncharacterized protein n=1 Tax=Trichomonascus vanleenenianus TaxID=2268995 RepID=UPI003ECB7D17
MNRIEGTREHDDDGAVDTDLFSSYAWGSADQPVDNPWHRRSSGSTSISEISESRPTDGDQNKVYGPGSTDTTIASQQSLEPDEGVEELGPEEARDSSPSGVEEELDGDGVASRSGMTKAHDDIEASVDGEESSKGEEERRGSESLNRCPNDSDNDRVVSRNSPTSLSEVTGPIEDSHLEETTTNDQKSNATCEEKDDQDEGSEEEGDDENEEIKDDQSEEKDDETEEKDDQRKGEKENEDGDDFDDFAEFSDTNEVGDKASVDELNEPGKANGFNGRNATELIATLFSSVEAKSLTDNPGPDGNVLDTPNPDSQCSVRKLMNQFTRPTRQFVLVDTKPDPIVRWRASAVEGQVLKIVHGWQKNPSKRRALFGWRNHHRTASAVNGGGLPQRRVVTDQPRPRPTSVLFDNDTSTLLVNEPSPRVSSAMGRFASESSSSSSSSAAPSKVTTPKLQSFPPMSPTSPSMFGLRPSVPPGTPPLQSPPPNPQPSSTRPSALALASVQGESHVPRVSSPLSMGFDKTQQPPTSDSPDDSRGISKDNEMINEKAEDDEWGDFETFEESQQSTAKPAGVPIEPVDRTVSKEPLTPIASSHFSELSSINPIQPMHSKPAEDSSKPIEPLKNSSQPAGHTRDLSIPIAPRHSNELPFKPMSRALPKKKSASLIVKSPSVIDSPKSESPAIVVESSDEEDDDGFDQWGEFSIEETSTRETKPPTKLEPANPVPQPLDLSIFDSKPTAPLNSKSSAPDEWSWLDEFSSDKLQPKPQLSSQPALAAQKQRKPLAPQSFQLLSPQPPQPSQLHTNDNGDDDFGEFEEFTAPLPPEKEFPSNPSQPPGKESHSNLSQTPGTVSPANVSLSQPAPTRAESRQRENDQIQNAVDSLPDLSFMFR